MFNIEYFRQLLLIAILLSSITCAIVQKTKVFFANSKYIVFYSFAINMVISVLFCWSFTKIGIQSSLWIGLLSFVGADSIYKTLEGKISSYSDILNKNTVSLSEENIINKEDK